MNRESKVNKDRKNVRVDIRITKEEMLKLEEMSLKTGQSKSDILRDGLRIKYNLHKYRD